MGEPNFSIDFTARVIASQACAVGDLLVFDSADGFWRVSNTANRTAADARSQAVALTAYGGSMVGKVSYQASGTVAQSISGLSPGYSGIALVRASTTGRFERIVGYTLGDDVVGYAEPDGRVHLHLGIPWQLITGQAARSLGHYDPRDYGAALDGVTDDILAFRAMHDDIPTTGGWVDMPVSPEGMGQIWFSDTWTVTKPIYIDGQSGHEGRRSGFYLAPGKKVEFISAGGELGGYFQVWHTNFRSRNLIHSTAHGNDDGTGIPYWSAGATMRLGDCVTKGAAASPTRMFRCTDTGAGTSAVVLAGSEPAWSTTLGATLTDAHGISWITEAIPQMRIDTHAYVVGDRVFTKNDNRWMFTCTVAGTSGSTALQGNPGIAAQATGVFSGNYTMGDVVTDGGVTWLVDSPCGIYVNANFAIIDRAFVENFSGPAILVLGGEGLDVRGFSAADDVRLSNIQAYSTGCGVALGGSDGNDWTIDKFVGFGFGRYHPAATAIGTYPYPDGGQGGHGIHDHSDAGGSLTDCTFQVSSGRPILKTGNGLLTVLGCFEEFATAAEALFVTGQVSLMGGNMNVRKESSALITVIDAIKGRGLREVDPQGAVSLFIRLTVFDACRVYYFAAPQNSDLGAYALSYSTPGQSPAGCWSMQFGEQVVNNAYYLTTPVLGHAGTYPDPGPGWLGFERGHLVGHPTGSDPLFVGHVDAFRTNLLRNGRRIKGDRFFDEGLERLLTDDGWTGIRPWPSDSLTTGIIGATTMDWGLPCSTIEPTANTGTNAGGEKVFICTVGGRTGMSEPNWSTATVVGNTVVDNTTTWKLVGFTPPYAVRDTNQNEFSSGGKPGRAFSDWDTVSTTNATPANVLSISVPAAIYGDAVIVVHVEVTASFVDSGNTVGGSLSKKAAFRRTGGTLTRVAISDLDDATLYTGPATGDFDIAVLDNNTIKVPVTGIAATNITWTASAHLQIAKVP